METPREPDEPPALDEGSGKGNEGAVPPLSGLLILVSLAMWPLAALHRLVNSDIWWHLTAGRWIAGEFRVPTEEFASWTARGTPWFDYEWLWQLGALGLWEAGGGPALVLSTAVLALATGVLLFLAIREGGGGPALWAVLLWVALFTARVRFQSRPEMISFPLVALIVWLLLRVRRTGRWQELWFVVPLMALWANLHPGFLFGAGLMGLAVAGEALDWIRARRRGAGADEMEVAGSRLKGLTLMTAGCVLATLLTPRPLGPHLLILESFTGFRAVGFRNLEWEPMPFAMDTLPFWGLLGVTAVLVLADLRRVPLAHLLWLGAFGLLAVQTQRSAALLALVAPPVAAWSLGSLLGGRNPRPALRLVLEGALCLGAVALLPASFRSPVAPPGLDVAWSRQPVEAASFIGREDPVGRIFNHYRLGGYLQYRFWPERLVFADGKHIPYLPVLARMEESMGKGYAAFQAFLREGGVEIAVLHYDQPLERVRYGPDPQTGREREGLRAWSALWFHRQDWAVVFWDEAAMVKLRRGGPNGALIERFEYRHIDPEDRRWQVRQVSEGRLDGTPILADLERRLREEPGCPRALELREAFLGASPATDSRP